MWCFKIEKVCILKVLKKKFKYKGLLKLKKIIDEIRSIYEVRNKDQFEDSHYNFSNDVKMLFKKSRKSIFKKFQM